jgi:hypothetical protein
MLSLAAFIFFASLDKKFYLTTFSIVGLSTFLINTLSNQISAPGGAGGGEAASKIPFERFHTIIRN